jgi:hypothetical protein
MTSAPYFSEHRSDNGMMIAVALLIKFKFYIYSTVVEREASEEVVSDTRHRKTAVKCLLDPEKAPWLKNYFS